MLQSYGSATSCRHCSSSSCLSSCCSICCVTVMITTSGDVARTRRGCRRGRGGCRHYGKHRGAVAAAGGHRQPPPPRRDPLMYGAMADLARRCDTPVMYLQLGELPVVVISSPDAAREVMKTHDGTFATRPLSLTGRAMAADELGIVFEPYGKRWWRLPLLQNTFCQMGD
ncbi:hypothetical protein ACP4OV_014172 [Aristida adscensionis]